MELFPSPPPAIWKLDPPASDEGGRGTLLMAVELVGKVGVGLYVANASERVPSNPWNVLAPAPCSAFVRGNRRIFFFVDGVGYARANVGQMSRLSGRGRGMSRPASSVAE